MILLTRVPVAPSRTPKRGVNGLRREDQKGPGVNECNPDVTSTTLLSLPKMLLGEAGVKIGFAVVALTLLIAHLAAAQEVTGSICVAARLDDPFWKESATLPEGGINSHGLRVKIDKRPAVAWPDRKSLKIEGLDTSERHLLVVLGPDSKPIESVRFRFSDYRSAELCMAYDGYQGIGLQEETRRTPWCKCRKGQ